MVGSFLRHLSNTFKMTQLSPAELATLLSSANAPILIDVRELWERDEFNIGGLHIPLGELNQRRNELPVESDLVFYCEKGIRSTIAIQRLEEAGYQHLANLSGGMKAWKLVYPQNK